MPSPRGEGAERSEADEVAQSVWKATPHPAGTAAPGRKDAPQTNRLRRAFYAKSAFSGK